MKQCTFKMVAVALLVAVCSMTAAAQVPDIHYLRFNEGTGGTTADLALPGVGAAPTIPLSGWTTTQQKLGTAGFKATPSTAVGNHVKTNVLTNINGSWTIETWLFDNDTTGALRYYCGDSTAGAFRLYKTGVSPASVVIAGTGMTALTVPAALPIQTWTHVAFTYDSVTGLLTCYVNGVQAGQNTQAAPLSFVGTGAAGLSIGGYATSTQWVGGMDEFRMWGSARTATEISASMNMQLNSFSDDAAVSDISAPTDSVGCQTLSSTETVTFTMRNYGTNQILAGTFVQADLSVDGGAATTEFFTVTSTLNSGASESFTFLTTANLVIVGPHTIDVTILVAGDLNAANDHAQKIVSSGGPGVVSSYPYTENFDSSTVNNGTVPPVGWKQDTADATGTDSDWYMHTGQTGSLNTGPLADHTTGAAGYYAYCEDSTGSYAQVNLLSPCLDLSSIISPRLQFWLFSYNGNPGGGNTQENFLSVDVISYPGGVVTMDALGPIGHQPTATTWANAQWTLQTLDLTPFAFQTIELQFRGRSDNGGANTFYHDIAIDDVTLFDFQQGVGQGGQPGLAVLDLNNATNQIFGGGDPFSGDNGPFMANATAGGPLTFTLAGETFAPMILLVGPLNPLVASYPGIGQFDIGGPLDPQGIPTQLAVIGDGFNPFTFIDALFNTGGTGQTILTFQTPGFPAGVLAGFQAAFATTNGNFFAISNAVELTIM